MEHISRIGMDTSKHIFQLHGVNAAEEPVLRRKLRRKEMMKFFEELPATQVAIEACGSSHHWARLLQSFGHAVKLIPPQFVKPYVKRNKNDAADAEALCEAMDRPTMRFVPVKTAEQQAALMLVGVRERLLRNRTQLSNAIRGYAAEFGITASKGLIRIEQLLEGIATDEMLPALARELFALHGKEYEQLNLQLEKVEARLMAWHRADACSQRLAQIPGIGPIDASMLVMKTPAPETFRSGRYFAAWLGLTPKDHSTAGKSRLGNESRGDEGTQSPTLTLELGRGACRDFAVLFVEAVRCLGFGGRIVSGYLYNGGQAASLGNSDKGTTHAWAEVYVPGAGWISFDPTNRNVGGFNLIPVAVARNIGQAMPLSGTFGGTDGAFESISVHVEVTEIPG